MTTEPLPDFGMTNPCANIAKHFGVAQAYVDVSMEWALYEKQVRTRRPAHTTLYWQRAPRHADWPEMDVRKQVQDAVDTAVAAIVQDAERRRTAFEAAARAE